MSIECPNALVAFIERLQSGGPRERLILRGDLAKNMGRAMNVTATAQRRGGTEEVAANVGLALSIVGIMALPVVAPIAVGAAALGAAATACFGVEWAKRRNRSGLRTARDTPFGPEAVILVEHGYEIGTNHGDMLELVPA